MTIDYTMDDATYHSRPELSSTGARRILESPADFKYWRDHPQEAKPEFDLGTAVHTKVLGTGSNVVVYPQEHLTPSGNVSTKAATVSWAAEQRNAGLVPIGPWEARKVDAMAEAVLAYADARSVLEQMEHREVSVFADVEGVPSRARFDLYGGNVAADLKTARAASPKGFNRAVGAHGYHIQKQWYREIHASATGVEIESFKFVVVRNTAPHLVGVYDLDFMWDEVAAKGTKKARRLYRESVESGEWCGQWTATLTPPTYMVYDADEEEEFTF